MRKIVIIISILFLVFFDLGSKIFIEDTVFGSWKEICTNPELNSAATPEYCEQNTLRISNFFSIELSHNNGIAFSLPIEWLLLKIITLSIILFLLFIFIKDEYPKNSRLIDTAYTFIFAGALSHAYERIFVWHVVDFIAVKYFAILNLADILISIWAFLILFSYGYYYRKHR